MKSFVFCTVFGLAPAVVLAADHGAPTTTPRASAQARPSQELSFNERVLRDCLLTLIQKQPGGKTRFGENLARAHERSAKLGAENRLGLGKAKGSTPFDAVANSFDTWLNEFIKPGPALIDAERFKPAYWWEKRRPFMGVALAEEFMHPRPSDKGPKDRGENFLRNPLTKKRIRDRSPYYADQNPDGNERADGSPLPATAREAAEPRFKDKFLLLKADHATERLAQWLLDQEFEAVSHWQLLEQATKLYEGDVLSALGAISNLFEEERHNCDRRHDCLFGSRMKPLFKNDRIDNVGYNYHFWSTMADGLLGHYLPATAGTLITESDDPGDYWANMNGLALGNAMLGATWAPFDLPVKCEASKL